MVRTLLICILSMCTVSFGTYVPNLDLTLFYHSLSDYFDVLVFTSELERIHDARVRTKSFAGRKISSLDKLQNQFKVFCSPKVRAIIVLPSNTSDFIAFMKMACMYSTSCAPPIQRKQFWTPYLFIIWPHPISSHEKFENEIIESYTSECVDNGNSFLMDSEVYIIASTRSGKIIVYELYSIDIIITFQEIQQKWDKLVFEVFQRTVTRRQDFKGFKIRAVGQERVSYGTAAVHFKEIDGELFFESGYNAVYFLTMAKALNINPIVARGGGIISQTSDGLLGGIGRQLIDGEVDISVQHSEFLPYRARHLAFLHPHYVSRMVAYFKQPTSTSIRDIYIRSIKIELRVAIVCTWVIILVSLVIISLIHWKVRNLDLNDSNFSNALDWAIGAFCQQGSQLHPSTISMRIGVLVSLLFSVIVYIGFSASVVSQLSVPVIPIKSFEDILKYNLQIREDNWTESTREFMEYAIKQGIVKAKGNFVTSISPEQSVKEIAENNIAFLSVPDEFYLTQSTLNYSDNFLCKTISEVYVNPVGMPVLSGMAVRKDSPYTEFLKFIQLQMREYGIHQRLMVNYERLSTPKCQRVQAPETLQLGLHETLGAFTCLLGLTMLSLLILCLEICLQKSQIFQHWFRNLKLN